MTEIVSRDVLRAIYKGETDLLIKYIAEGFDIHEVTQKERWNFLHRATVSVSPKMPINIDALRVLIGEGLDVNAKDSYGNTPLQYAARVKNVEAINLLIAEGAEVNTLNKDCLTPLQHMFQSKPYVYEAVDMLLANGANPDHPLPSSSKTIRDLVATICHGEDAQINDLFDMYSKKT